MKKSRNIFGFVAAAALVLGTARPSFGQQDTGRVVLSLEQCREMALHNDVDTKNAALDLASAKARKGEALAEYFPSASLSAFGYYAFDPLLEMEVSDILGDSPMGQALSQRVNEMAVRYGIDPVFRTARRGFSATVQVTQPLFAGGRIVSGNRLAALGVQAAALQLSLQQKKSVSQVEKDYWQVVSLQEKLVTLDAVGSMLDNLEKDLSAAIAAGLSTETDRLQLTVKQNELKSARSRLIGGLRLAKMNLCDGIGFEYTPYSVLAGGDLPYIDDIVIEDRIGELEDPQAYWKDEGEILQLREEARLLELSVEAKRMEKRMVRGEVLPQVGVGLAYGYGDMIMGEPKFNGAVIATVKVPLTDWGKYSRKLQRSENEVQKARNEQERLSSRLLLQTRQLWLNLTVAWEQAGVAQDGVDAAQAGVDRLQAHYKAGLVPLSDLLEAQTALQRSSDELVDARIAYRNALADYVSLYSSEKTEE